MYFLFIIVLLLISLCQIEKTNIWIDDSSLISIACKNEDLSVNKVNHKAHHLINDSYVSNQSTVQGVVLYYQKTMIKSYSLNQQTIYIYRTCYTIVNKNIANPYNHKQNKFSPKAAIYQIPNPRNYSID